MPEAILMPLCGFLVVESSVDPKSNYRGVDRLPFLGTLGDRDGDARVKAAADLYAASLTASRDEAEFIAYPEAARTIAQLLSEAGFPHEVLECRAERGDQGESRPPGELWGYDVAYYGGDYFSALRDAATAPPERRAILGSYARDRRTGLFLSLADAKAFLARYLASPGSEEGDFCVFEVRSPRLA